MFGQATGQTTIAETGPGAVSRRLAALADGRRRRVVSRHFRLPASEREALDVTATTVRDAFLRTVEGLVGGFFVALFVFSLTRSLHR